MSILLIRGPEPAGPVASCPGGIPRQVVAQLVEHAASAHRTIALRACGEDAELLDCLERAGSAEFVLFDPGACARGDALRAQLDGLAVPYVEVHDDLCGALEAPLACGHPLQVIQGYGVQGYTVALSIALEHLGCAECENNYHVGT